MKSRRLILPGDVIVVRSLTSLYKDRAVMAAFDRVCSGEIALVLCVIESYVETNYEEVMVLTRGMLGWTFINLKDEVINRV